MSESLRRKSPRAPSLPLDEALEKALRAYDKERLHPAPTEVVAQNIGYKSANSGSALAAIASLRYFGLFDRPKDGLLAVTKEVETYKFSPDDEIKRSSLIKFLFNPSLYSDLLNKYPSALPSEANLRYELIQRGFSPSAAESVLSAFIRSVQFSQYFEYRSSSNKDESEISLSVTSPNTNTLTASHHSVITQKNRVNDLTSPEVLETPDLDKIPVRLSGGRRAWLLIPVPFFNADKQRLKAQIDLILTEEEDLA